MGVLKRTWRGEYRGGTPSVVICSGGMYGARRRKPPRPVDDEGGCSRNEPQSMERVSALCDNGELRPIPRQRNLPYTLAAREHRRCDRQGCWGVP